MAKKKLKGIPKRKQANLSDVRRRRKRRIQEKLPRYEVDQARSWHLARSHPRWARKAAEQLVEAGIAVYQARDEVDVIRPDGRRTVARVPLLRQLLFVGIEHPSDISKVTDHIGIAAVLSRNGEYSCWKTLTVRVDRNRRW